MAPITLGTAITRMTRLMGTTRRPTDTHITPAIMDREPIGDPARASLRPLWSKTIIMATEMAPYMPVITTPIITTDLAITTGQDLIGGPASRPSLQPRAMVMATEMARYMPVTTIPII